MKLIILCALFVPILYFAFRQKKWYLYLLFAFMGVLPEQFSVRVHESLPLVTATRVLILIVMGFWIFDKWKTRKFQFPKSLIAFMVINIIVSLINLRYGAGDIKRIFLLLFERVFLVIILMDTIHNKEEFHRCIDFSIMGCAALAVIGIVQTVFDYDISSVLHLTETITSIQLSGRMGLVRAYGTYNAISYGCYCVFMSGLIMYRLFHTKNIWHAAAFALNFVALVCTFTRSAWLCMGGIFVLVLLVYRMKLIRRLIPAFGIALALFVVLCCFQPRMYKAFVQTGRSSINTVISILPDSVTSLLKPADSGAAPTSPEENKLAVDEPFFELDEEFGMNATDPTYSRMAQWSAVEYMLMDGQALFGYGYNALPEGRIHFFFDRWEAKWVPTTFLDVGLVALLMEGGFVGALSFLGLLCYMLVVALRKRSCPGEMDFYWLTIFMIPLFVLLNFLASFMFASVVWLFIALFYTYQQTEPQLPETAQ